MKLPIFIVKRIFDYMEKKGLEKITDINIGEWDFYILKELIDNALDADEYNGKKPKINIRIFYGRKDENKGALEISVKNQSCFPIDSINKIFMLDYYASIKDFFNNITRGAQGNALKTIIGMPYAIHHYIMGNYNISYYPLTIYSGNIRVDLKIRIDESCQKAQIVSNKSILPERLDGTKIIVRIAGYIQKTPREMAKIIDLARQFILWNPHCSFKFIIEIEGENTEEIEFERTISGRKIIDKPPVSWYRFDQFTKLMNAFVSHEGSDFETNDFLKYFKLFKLNRKINKYKKKRIEEYLNNDRLRAEFYDSLLEVSPKTELTDMGEIGKGNMEKFLDYYYETEEELVYKKVVDDKTRYAPYVLEMLISRLQRIDERKIWVGINHSPVLKDPFYRKEFQFEYEGSIVRTKGIEKFLDEFGLDKKENILVGVHLICPNIEFQTYGKSEIDDIPFKNSLTKSLKEMLVEFRERSKTRDGENEILDLIPKAIQIVSSNGEYRFSMDQLFFALKKIIRRDGLIEWGNQEDYSRLLNIIIPKYEEKNGYIGNLIRTHKGKFIEPYEDYQIIFWVLKNRFEDILIANNLHNKWNFAIIWSDKDISKAFETLTNSLENNKEYLIYCIHDADVDGIHLSNTLRQYIINSKYSNLQFIDLGLTPSQGHKCGLLPEKTDFVKQELREKLEKILVKDDVEFLFEKKLKYDLNQFSTERFLTWFAERNLEIGIYEGIEKSALEIFLIGIMKEKLRERIENEIQDIIGIETVIDEIIAEIEKHNLENIFRKRILPKVLKCTPDTWKFRIDDLLAELYESFVEKQMIEENLHMLEIGAGSLRQDEENANI